MAEKTYPPRFDFKKLEPDVSVEFTLLKESFSREATDNKGEKYWWHLWAVKHTDVEMSLFTPNERVHAGLLSLKVKPGDKFVMTKRQGWNTEKGSQFIYYEMACDGQTIDTRNTEPTSAPKPEETKPVGPLDDTEYIKEPKGMAGLAVNEQFRGHYNRIMDIKINYLETRINIQNLTDEQYADILKALDKSTSRNVTSMLIEGNK